MDIELGDLPTWLTALATGAAWAAALTGLHRERSTRLKQDTRDRERADRSQAVKVSAWYGGAGGGDRLTLLNRAETPVYNIVATLVFVQGAAPHAGEEYQALGRTDHHACLSVLPPGMWFVPTASGWAGMHRHPGAEIAFTDEAGLHWVRRASGQLEELATEPFDHFKIPRPISLMTPSGLNAD